jgi:hypothetical protein
MSFIEFLVDRPFSNDDIIDTCAMLLDISATSITVVEDIAAWQADPRVALVCEVAAVRGDFALRVGLYAREPALDARLGELFIEQFAQRLDRACLVSDASPIRSPGSSSMVLICADQCFSTRNSLIRMRMWLRSPANRAATPIASFAPIT